MNRGSQNDCHSIFSRLNVSPASFQFTVLEGNYQTTLNPGAETRFSIDGLYLVSGFRFCDTFATICRSFVSELRTKRQFRGGRDKETSVLSDSFELGKCLLRMSPIYIRAQIIIQARFELYSRMNEYSTDNKSYL